MKDDRSNAVLISILEKIELPDSAYEKAEKRYNDLGEWFHRPESSCAEYEPHVFPQGSFRLGTAIKPDAEEEYDLDLSCNLEKILSKDLITQEQLKHHIGHELELYRRARNIKEDLAEKKRCWRLDYADGLSFHMDIVPCIPEKDTRRQYLKQRMVEASLLDDSLAQRVSELAVSITDNTDPKYKVITDMWRISNPEGFARWFESRMRTAQAVINEREMNFKASIDSFPYYKWKTPLQSAVQILKRHRDTMFRDNDDAKPISVIITTLAAKAYNGETDLVSALENILACMGNYVNTRAPYVPNPVNPDEDFADKWNSEGHQHLNLRENFYMWLHQAKADLKTICSKENSQLIVEAADQGFSIVLNKNEVEHSLGLSPAIVTPITRIESSNNNPRPWCK